MKDIAAESRELLWALHRRAKLRARLLHGGSTYVVVRGEEDSWHLLPVPSVTWVRFLDEWADRERTSVLSEEALERLNTLVHREALRATGQAPEGPPLIAPPVEHPCEPARPRPIWDESEPEFEAAR